MLISFQSFAYTGHCTSNSGTNIYTYTVDFTSTQNTVGYTTPWQSQTASGTYYIGGGCDDASVYYSGQPSSSMTLASTDSDGTNWYNVQDNDYLQVASQIYIYSRTGTSTYHNVPFVDISNNCNYSCGNTAAASGSKTNIRLKIKKKFVGSSFIFNEPIAYLYANQGATGLGYGTPIVTIDLNATMTVPQSCTINAGTIVDFNFGNLSAQSFAETSPGDKPSTATTLTKNVGISCNNIAAQSTMTLRIEANNVSGNAIISDNSDVGFVLANASGNPLTPNNISSVIPFTLDSNDSANITLQSWPVSITGVQPTAGIATAVGYLRVDYQ